MVPTPTGKFLKLLEFFPLLKGLEISVGSGKFGKFDVRVHDGMV